MNISEKGIQFIKSNEGLSLKPYPDMGGFSIGYGHHYPPGVYVPSEITEDQATNLLLADLKRVETCLDSLVPADCTQNQYDALCDFGYNLGIGAMDMMLSHGWSDVPNQMPRWIYAGGKVNQGLVERRKKEVALFNSP